MLNSLLPELAVDNKHSCFEWCLSKTNEKRAVRYVCAISSQIMSFDRRL